jgi:hypothetical protein
MGVSYCQYRRADEVVERRLADHYGEPRVPPWTSPSRSPLSEPEAQDAPAGPSRRPEDGR